MTLCRRNIDTVIFGDRMLWKFVSHHRLVSLHSNTQARARPSGSSRYSARFFFKAAEFLQNFEKLVSIERLSENMKRPRVAAHFP